MACILLIRGVPSMRRAYRSAVTGRWTVCQSRGVLRVERGVRSSGEADTHMQLN